MNLGSVTVPASKSLRDPGIEEQGDPLKFFKSLIQPGLELAV